MLFLFLAFCSLSSGPLLGFGQLSLVTRPPAVLPFDTVQFRAPRGPFVIAVGQTISIALCQTNRGAVQNLVAPNGGRPDAGNCGWVNMPDGTTNPTGGNPPYHFQLATMGGFAPFGVTLHPTTGFLTGVAKWPGTRTFQVCAVDMSENWKCDPITITIQPKPQRDRVGAIPKPALASAVSECSAVTDLVPALDDVVSRAPDWEKKTEAMLAAARDGKIDAQAALLNTLRQGLSEYLQEHGRATGELTAAIRNLPPQVRLSPEAESWQRRIDALKTSQEVLERAPHVASATKTLVEQLQSNAGDWRAFANFLQDTGFGDDFATQLASLAGGGRSAEMALKAAMLSRDAVFAGIEQSISARDMESAQRALDALRSAAPEAANLANQTRQLAFGDCPKAEQRANQSGNFNATTPTAKKGSGGKVAAGLIVAAGAGIGGYYYLNKTLNELSNIDDPSSSGGSGGGDVTFVSTSGLTCLYNGGGVLSSCSGTITVNITLSMPVSSSLRLGTEYGVSGTNTTNRSPQGSLTFQMQGGIGGSNCPAPLRQLNLTGGNIPQGSAYVIVSNVNVPVTCR
jgi:hypothetical protein